MVITIIENSLETVQRAWWGHSGHTGPIDSAELNLRYIKGDGGRLQTGLHYLQWTRQYGSYCAPTSGKGRQNEKGDDDTEKIFSVKPRNQSSMCAINRIFISAQILHVLV